MQIVYPDAIKRVILNVTCVFIPFSKPKPNYSYILLGSANSILFTNII